MFLCQLLMELRPCRTEMVFSQDPRNFRWSLWYPMNMTATSRRKIRWRGGGSAAGTGDPIKNDASRTCPHAPLQAGRRPDWDTPPWYAQSVLDDI